MELKLETTPPLCTLCFALHKEKCLGAVVIRKKAEQFCKPTKVEEHFRTEVTISWMVPKSKQIPSSNTNLEKNKINWNYSIWIWALCIALLSNLSNPTSSHVSSRSFCLDKDPCLTLKMMVILSTHKASNVLKILANLSWSKFKLCCNYSTCSCDRMKCKVFYHHHSCSCSCQYFRIEDFFCLRIHILDRKGHAQRGGQKVREQASVAMVHQLFMEFILFSSQKDQHIQNEKWRDSMTLLWCKS